MTSGGYGYTVERSIAYAYLPAEVEIGAGVEVDIFGRWVGRRGRARAAVRPDGRPHSRGLEIAPARERGVGVCEQFAHRRL